MNNPQGGVSAVVLGIMQDAGLPHAGCRCARCAAAYANPARAQHSACLGLVDARERPARVWLIDATPDIRWQLDALAAVLGPHPGRLGRLRQPDGIFLSHGHLGHVGGLPQFGPEGMAAVGLPVYASRPLAEVVRGSAVWRPMLSGVEWRELADGTAVVLSPGLSVTPLAVPHRDEWGAGTFAFRVQGPSGSLLYLPDIDSWEQWPEARAAVAGVDVALLDATFYNTAELGGRQPPAHPLVTDTLARFADTPTRLLLTHINHTNPLLDEYSAERAVVARAGAAVAEQGQVIQL